jgi:23S rRNA (adenine2503-C2)-methyltransferase
MSIRFPHFQNGLNNLVTVDNRFTSADGSVRYLLQLDDGERAEAVLIPREGRTTICISSQVGCALGCTFCLTGQLGLVRDLSADEIIAQALCVRGSAERFSIVLMGMGEPLANYDNVLEAVRFFHDDHGLKLPMSRITISTAGLVPAIRRLGAEPLFPNLSVSLTGVTKKTRDMLMPINRKYPIETLMEVIGSLPPQRQKRVMFECVMLKGITDSAADAETLAQLVRGMNVKVNLIPLNPSEDIPYQRSGDDAIRRFQDILLANGVATFIRKNRGNDVFAACGQLKQKAL